VSSDTQVAIEAGDTLENLVNQFTDPYACLRELIQNAMDAGSESIDVWFEFNPYEKGDKGIAIIHLDDTGEGMTRRIIDTKLTQLFSSNKEDDLTKVGKFGIGFVSVFALEPNAVIVDTGRDGEYWRLIFKENRKFDRILLNHPVEGTQIQIVKETTPAEFEKMKRRSADTITYWCKHVESEITCDGQVLNEEFRIGHRHEYVHKGTETEIVVAPSDQTEPFFGFYNRGLTLREGEKEYHRGVAFKVSSRYLEHTLTRDNVITDKNYDKAMALLAEVIDGDFRKQLFSRAASSFDYELFGHLAPRLGKRIPSEYATMPLLPTVSGQRVSIKTVQKAAKSQKMILYSTEDTPLTRAITSEKGVPVLKWEGPEKQPGLERLLDRITSGKPVVKAERAWALPQIQERFPETKRRLLIEANKLMRNTGSKYKELVPADFSEHSEALADTLYVEQMNAGELCFVGELAKPKNWKNFLLGFVRAKHLVVNVTHPLIEPHFQLFQARPMLAAYLFTKALTIDDGLDAETESKLLEAALEMDR
jgi:molecular chaperone HtpG